MVPFSQFWPEDLWYNKLMGSLVQHETSSSLFGQHWYPPELQDPSRSASHRRFGVIDIHDKSERFWILKIIPDQISGVVPIILLTKYDNFDSKPNSNMDLLCAQLWSLAFFKLSKIEFNYVWIFPFTSHFGNDPFRHCLGDEKRLSLHETF